MKWTSLTSLDQLVRTSPTNLFTSQEAAGRLVSVRDKTQFRGLDPWLPDCLPAWMKHPSVCSFLLLLGKIPTAFLAPEKKVDVQFLCEKCQALPLMFMLASLLTVLCLFSGRARSRDGLVESCMCCYCRGPATPTLDPLTSDPLYPETPYPRAPWPWHDVMGGLLSHDCVMWSHNRGTRSAFTLAKRTCHLWSCLWFSSDQSVGIGEIFP